MKFPPFISLPLLVSVARVIISYRGSWCHDSTLLLVSSKIWIDSYQQVLLTHSKNVIQLLNINGRIEPIFTSQLLISMEYVHDRVLYQSLDIVLRSPGQV